MPPVIALLKSVWNAKANETNDMHQRKKKKKMRVVDDAGSTAAPPGENSVKKTLKIRDSSPKTAACSP